MDHLPIDLERQKPVTRNLGRQPEPVAVWDDTKLSQACRGVKGHLKLCRNEDTEKP